MSIVNKQCKTCKFWEQQSVDGEPINVGLCKRFPPQGFCMFKWDGDVGYETFNFIGQWQNRNEDDWCGEHCEKL